MKIIDYHEPINTPAKTFPAYFAHFYPKEKLLFFDIETTGFAARSSTLYLIGALWYEDDQLCIRQWFNDDTISESTLLASFDEFSKNFTMLVHFNGLGFDLPYLKQKAELLHISLPCIFQLKQLDIFKEIRSYKTVFGLDSMKQTALEHYLGIERKDSNTGGELINIYQRYAARPNQEQENMLLLHNHDDLCGMPQISQIFDYKAFFTQLSPDDINIKKAETNSTKDKFKILFSLPEYAFLPKRITCFKNGCYLNACELRVNLQLPIFSGTLKHFFPDWQNYYYLPAEDMSIHKSVAAFVDRTNKIKASKNTCYVKKTDAFIPCCYDNLPELYQADIKEQTYYITLESFLAAPPSTQNSLLIRLLITFV